MLHAAFTMMQSRGLLPVTASAAPQEKHPEDSGKGTVRGHSGWRHRRFGLRL